MLPNRALRRVPAIRADNAATPVCRANSPRDESWHLILSGHQVRLVASERLGHRARVYASFAKCSDLFSPALSFTFDIAFLRTQARSMLTNQTRPHHCGDTALL